MIPKMDRPNPSPKGDNADLREAEEVVILMHRNYAISRSIRANWYMDHLDKPVQICPVDEISGKDMFVCGMLPQGGSADEVLENEKLLVTVNTKVSYIARYYRQVYVLDVSPSMVVADEVAGCCLYTLLLEQLKVSLTSLVQPVTLPGSQYSYVPQIFLTVLVFTPYLCFHSKSVILQGALVTFSNVELVLRHVEKRFMEFLLDLHHHSQPIMKSWEQKHLLERRRYDSRNTSTVSRRTKDECLIVDTDDEEEGELWEVKAPDLEVNVEDVEKAQPDHNPDLFSIHRDIWKTKGYSEGETPHWLCEGYIHPEWALLFMIRMGILAVHMLPEDTMANVVLITDGVCGVPEASAMNDVIVQMRSYAISCSFIQVQGRPRSEPSSFGHVVSYELLHFLSTSTFGSYILSCQERSEGEENRLNRFQRLLLSWSFDKALKENTHLVNLVMDINPGFAYINSVDNRRHFEMRLSYDNSVRDMLYVRLREGFTMKNVKHMEDRFEITLLLPFRPMVAIEYIIYVPHPFRQKRKERISAEIYLTAPYHMIRELLADPTTVNPTRQKSIQAYRDTINGIIVADGILTHMQYFRSNVSYFTVPEGLDHSAIALFKAKDLPHVSYKFNEDSIRPRFDKFWRRLVCVEESLWHRWSHTVTIRMLVDPSRAPYHPFSNPDCIPDYGPARKAVETYLSQITSFCLLHRKSFVMFLPDKVRRNGSPKYLCVLRLVGEPPFFAIRMSFIGGVANSRRREIVREIKGGLSKLHFDGQQVNDVIPKHKAVLVVHRPLERIRVHYQSLPCQWQSVIRLRERDPSVPFHNALAKFLSASRVVWVMPSLLHQPSPEEVHFMADMIISRRLRMGYKVSSSSKECAVGLCRQVVEDFGVAVEQFICFPPILNQAEIKKTVGAFNCLPIQSEGILVTEQWVEPCARPKEGDLLEGDAVLLGGLFTCAKLSQLCSSRRRLRLSPSLMADGEVSSGAVRVRSVPLRLASVARHTPRHLMLLPFHVHATPIESDRRRAAIVLRILHAQFRHNSDASINIPDRKTWKEMLGDMDQTEEESASTLYVKRMSPWVMMGMLLPREVDKVLGWPGGGAVPVLFLSIDEPKFIHAVIDGRIWRSSVEDRRQSVLPVQEEDVPFIPLPYIRKTPDGDGYRHIDLAALALSMYEHVILKSLVVSLFISCNQGLVVSEEAVHDVMEEYGDSVCLEVGGVDRAFHSFCAHLHDGNTYDFTQQNAMSDEDDLELLFSSVISRFFRPIRGSPIYYYFVQENNDDNSWYATNGEEDELDVEGERMEKEEGEDTDEGVEMNASPAFELADEFVTGRAVSRQPHFHCENNLMSPLFLFFNCAVKFPNGSMDTFPIHSLPSCIHHVLNKTKNRPSEPFRVEDTRVSVDMYVVTWQMNVDNAMDEGVEGMSYHQEKSYHQERSRMFIRLLPSSQRTVVAKLMKSIGRLLEHEMVLMDSRRPSVDGELLNNISQFIHAENWKGESGRGDERSKNIQLVYPSPPAIEALKEKMDGMKVEYCRLKRVGDMFYACRVNNTKRFMKMLAGMKRNSMTSIEAPPPERIDTCEEDPHALFNRVQSDTDGHPDMTKKDIICDFWIIVTISDTMCVQFMQRYPNFVHQRVYESLWRKLKKMQRETNQRLLLNRMFETGDCNSLLINKPERRFNSDCWYTDDSEDGNDLPEGSRFHYAPGSFVCPVVAFRWFAVYHRPRLGMLSGPSSAFGAYEALRAGLEKFAVRNMYNVYVVKDVKGDVFYMQLHTTMASVQKSCREIPRGIRKNADRFEKSHALLTIHGVAAPAEEITKHLPETLHKRLNQSILTNLIAILSKNPYSVLNGQNVHFIQEDVLRPRSVSHFSIPAPIHSFLAAFFFYLRQHIQENWVPAKFKMQSGSGRFPVRGGRISFQPYPIKDKSLPDHYQPPFYLIVKEPKEGNRTVGIGAVEVRIINGDGTLAELTKGRLSLNSRVTLLQTSLGPQHDRRARFVELTSTSLVEDISEQEGVVVECILWEVGDVFEDYISTMTMFIQEALADVVSEFAIFNVPIIETAPPPLSPHNIQPRSSSRWLLGRDSSSEAPSTGPLSASLHPPGRNFFTFDSKRNSVSSDVDRMERTPAREVEPPSKCVNPSFLTAVDWLNFVHDTIHYSNPHSSAHSVSRYRHPISSPESALKVMEVIKTQLWKELCSESNPKNEEESEPNESIYLCEHKEGRYLVTNGKLFQGLVADEGFHVDRDSSPSVVLLAFVEQVFVETRRFGFEPIGEIPRDLQRLYENPEKEMFPPNISPFIPRVRMLIGYADHREITLLLYNFCSTLSSTVAQKVVRGVQWEESRMRILREVGLHKMGITHLSPYKESPTNSYVVLVTKEPELLLHQDFPADQMHFPKYDSLPRQYLLPLFKIYRYIEPAFLKPKVEACIWKDQARQMMAVRDGARKRVTLHGSLIALHQRTLKGNVHINDTELSDISSCARVVHFVQSPVLFFPKWRRQIACIRQPKKQPMGGSGKATPPSRTRSSTLSNHAVSPSLRFKNDDEDPCQAKLEQMLLSEYVEYLLSLDLRVFVLGEGARSRRSTHSMAVQDPRHCWLFSSIASGLVLVHLSFTIPYFNVNILVWSPFALGSTFGVLSGDEKGDDLRVLEEMKNGIVSNCHVHSFTYDFHLRMLSKYLVGKEEVFFYTGYNTFAFLLDFLQYYGCRPPYARNCIYEEKVSFNLQYGVHSSQIWENFLSDKQHEWKIVKMKADVDGNQSADFMLVSTEMMGDSETLRVVFHDNRTSTQDTFNLIIYLINVNNNHRSSFWDDRRREDSKASDGEFKTISPQMADDVKSSLEADIEKMVMMVNEGILPSVEGGTGRRRFSSGGHLAAMDKPRPLGSDVDSLPGSTSSLVKQADSDSKLNSQLSIQQSAPRRHRKHDATGPNGAADGAEIPRERATYIHFMSGRQRRLQKDIEDSMAQYRRCLQKKVLDAQWTCRRDSLWAKVIAIPDRKGKKTASDTWMFPRNAIAEAPTFSDLSTLLSNVRVIRMADRDPVVAQLLRGASAKALFAHIENKFGSERCRFFEHPHNTKKCLFVTNPNCLDSAFIVSATKETTPCMSLVLKEHGDDVSTEFQNTYVDRAFDEMVSCLISFQWKELSRRVPVE